MPSSQSSFLDDLDEKDGVSPSSQDTSQSDHEEFYLWMGKLMVMAGEVVKLERLTSSDEKTHLRKIANTQALISTLGAFVSRWGRLEQEPTAYLHLPFEDMVDDTRLLEPLNLINEQVMIMGGFNTTLIQNFVPSAVDGDQFNEFLDAVGGLAVAGTFAKAKTPKDRREISYTLLREFFIRNPLLTQAGMDEFIAKLRSMGLNDRKGFSAFQNRLVYRPNGEESDGPKRGFYQHTEHSSLPSFTEVCAYCGCPASKSRGQKKAVCIGAPWHSIMAHYGTRPAPKHDLILSRTFLRDITAAGRPEVHLHDDLEALGFEADLFPQEDACDVSFKRGRNRIFIDNKSYTNMKRLRELLEKDIIKENLAKIGATASNFYVVVPDALGDKRDMSDLRHHLHKNRKNRGPLHVLPEHVMTHSEFITKFQGARP